MRKLRVAGEVLVDRASYPDDALFEALLRYLEEDRDSGERECPGRADEAFLFATWQTNPGISSQTTLGL